ncbi:MAG: ABC transporter permease subunit, partial [Alphaproteobacteria bacterium]|nr:ABC transporter permease subunit [Alphaproteobacteria bacterium]
MAVSTEAVDRGRTTSLWNDPNARAIFWQVLVIALFIAAVSYFVVNTQANLEKRGIASGLEFLTLPAGFDIAMSIIGYDLNTATHGDVLINGIVNTLLIAILSIVTATFLGFIVGIFRLSHNFLINRIAYVFVETLRNIPLLLQLLFWYFAVIGTLPSVRQALSLGEGFFITQRGVFVPRPVPQAGFNITLIALL